jgi:hypothetical protein
MLSPNGVTRSGLMLLAIAILGVTPSLQATEVGSAPDAAQLLADARTQSMQLAKDAQALQGYTTGDLNLLIAGHGALMERIRQDVDKAGRLSLQMQSASGAAQKEGIDRVEPLLKELASILNTESMRIRRVSAVVQVPPYTDYLRASARLTSDLAWLIADVVDCADAKAKAEEIDRQIELINFD